MKYRLFLYLSVFGFLSASGLAQVQSDFLPSDGTILRSDNGPLTDPRVKVSARSAMASAPSTASTWHGFGKPSYDVDVEENQPDTQRLYTIVNECGADPKRLFDFVSNNIRFDPYWGYRKGPELTWLTKRGNDADQADLLVTLLRLAGFSAKYCSLTSSVPLAEAEAWFGVNNPDALNAAATTAGYSVYVGETYFQIRIICAVVNIDGQEYKMLPAYKQYSDVQGVDLAGSMQYNYSSLLTAAGGTATPISVQGVSQVAVAQQLRDYATNLATDLRANYPNSTLDEVLGGRRIIERHITTLSEAFPSSFSADWQETPSDTPHSTDRDLMWISVDATPDAWTPSLQANGSNRAMFDAGRCLSVSFGADGRGQIWVDDLLVAEEEKAATYPKDLYLTLSKCYSSWQMNGFSTKHIIPIKRGGNYVIIMDPGGIGCPEIEARRRDRMASFLRRGFASDSREVSAEALYLLGLHWCQQFDQASDLVARENNCIPILHHNIMVVKKTSGVAVDIVGAAPYVSRTGDDASALNAFCAMGLVGSALEGGCIHQQYPERNGVSTVKYCVLNNASGAKTYLATSENYDAVIKNDPGIVSGWDAEWRNTTFPQILAKSGGPWSLIIPQNGAISTDQLIGSGFFMFSPSTIGSLVAIPSSILNGGFDTSFDPINLSITDFVQEPNSGPASFENPVSLEPIDLYSGAYVFDREDLSLGGDGSRGLHFSRHYSSAASEASSDMGRGWNHSYRTLLQTVTDTGLGWGLGTPEQAASMIAATYVLNDLCKNDKGSAKGWVTMCLVADWAMDELQHNTMVLVDGRKNLRFTRRADGSYASPAGITAQLLKDPSTNRFRIEERFGRTIQFDSSWRIASYTDADGKALSYQYDVASGKLTSVTDCYGRTLSFAYYTSGPGNGLLHTVTDSTGRSVSYTYDADGQLVGAFDPENYAKSYAYNTSGKLWKIYNELGELVATNVYDNSGRVCQQLSEGDSGKAWLYAITGRSTTETKPTGEVTTYLFDERGRNTSVIDGAGGCTAMTYDGQDHLVGTIDPRGNQTLLEYDGAQNLRFVTNPNGHREEYRYDAQNHLKKRIDPAGKETQFDYDASHHLQQVIDAAGRTTGYEYYQDGNSKGLVKKITAPNGDVIQFEYDAHGSPKKIIRADGSVATPTYDLRGDLQSSQVSTLGDPNLHAMGFGYDRRRLMLTATDALGFGGVNEFDARGLRWRGTDRFGNTAEATFSPMEKLLGTTEPSGAQTQNHCDASGRVDRTTNALGEVTQFQYDAASRLRTTVNSLAKTGSNAFDAAGNVTGLTNFAGKSYGWSFTPLNQVDTLTTPLLRESKRTYDARDLLWTVKQPSGNTATLTYFDDQKLRQIVDPVGTISFDYDAKGRLWTVTEGNATLTREYDGLDRLKRFTDGSGNQLQYAYDGAGNLTALTYPDGKTVTYAYDSADRLQTVTDWANRVTQFGYDAHSRLSAVSLPNGTVRSYGYDAAGRVNLICDTSGRNVISRFDLGYDALNRIARETATPTLSATSIAAATMTYDDDNRLATWNGQTCVSDPDGNLTTGPLGGSLASFAFDARNRLTGAGGSTYSYDAENRRVAQTANGVTTSYVNDPQGALSRMLLAASALGTTRYVYANGMLLYGDTGDGLQVYHSDSRGSTVAITDGSGNVTDRVVYGDYGEIVSRTGTTATPFFFNGAHGVQTDSNGLCYMRARYYSPETRRFLNADPIGFGGGMNLYGYCGGDPVNGMDPFGLNATSAAWYNVTNTPTGALVTTGIRGTDAPGRFVTFGDSFLQTSLASSYGNHSNAPSFTSDVSSWAIWMMSPKADTAFKTTTAYALTGDASLKGAPPDTVYWKYTGSAYPGLTEGYFLPGEINYIGVGEGFARAGWPLFLADKADAMWKALIYSTLPTDAIYAWTAVGYNYWNSNSNGKSPCSNK